MTGPNTFITFLYYFSCTALITVVVLSGGTGAGLDTAYPYQTGILLGIVAGSIGAYFNRSVTVTFPFQNRKVFRKEINRILGEMGYGEAGKDAEYTIYCKPNMAGLFAGKLYLKWDAKEVSIVGRSNAVSKLRTSLDRDF